MPELSNIQTYEKIEGSNYKPTLERFANVLKNVELWNDEIKEAFDNFEWKVEDNGFVYSSITELGYCESNLSKIKVRPLLMVYTPAIDSTFRDCWISCDLLINTEEVRVFKDGKSYSNYVDFIKALSFAMHQEFKQTGIYYTDEAQDGNDFDGIRNNDQTKLWQFDYAVIPSALKEIYSNKPTTHEIKQHNGYFEAWYKYRWNAEL